jgi:lysophospholipase L1-like esterase
VSTSLPQKFKEFCRSVFVPCVDLTARLQQAVREGVDPYAPTDTHWSSEGHAVVAAELEPVLRDLEQQHSLPHEAARDELRAP